MAVPGTTKQNITVRLDRRTLRKAKILAAKRNASIGGLLAAQIETLVSEDDAYEQAIGAPSLSSTEGSLSAAVSSRPVTSGTIDRPSSTRTS